MKSIIKDAVLFCMPFIAYILVVVTVDPFNYFGKKSFLPSSSKSISKEIQPHLFSLIEFENSPKKNVALGDSRTNALLKTPQLSNYSDLAYGGGSLNEVIQTFWFVVKQTEIDTVLIGINFNLFNKYNTRFWVEETIERKSNFLTYSFNKYTFESSFTILRDLVFDRKTVLGKPEMTKDEFWNYQIDVTAEKFYEQFLYPSNYFEELLKISQYCQKEDIELIIWIPPTHIEFQERVKDFNLLNEQLKFKSQINEISPVFDFDIDSELTRERSNFKDPLHFTDSIGHLIYEDIFLRKYRYCNYNKMN